MRYDKEYSLQTSPNRFPTENKIFIFIVAYKLCYENSLKEFIIE